MISKKSDSAIESGYEAPGTVGSSKPIVLQPTPMETFGLFDMGDANPD
jgi:hypothetical protein